MYAKVMYKQDGRVAVRYTDSEDQVIPLKAIVVSDLFQLLTAVSTCIVMVETEVPVPTNVPFVKFVLPFERQSMYLQMDGTKAPSPDPTWVGR